MKRYGKGRLLLAALLLVPMLLSVQAYALTQCADGEHVFDVTLIQAATAESDGIRRYSCEICGYSYDEAIPATAHQWGEWTTDVPPGCTESGRRYSTCAICGETKSETVAALGHDYQRAEREPTCTQAGAVTYTCSRCAQSYTEPGAAALGHSYQLTAEQAAESGKAGWREYTCTRCKETYREEIPALAQESPAAETPRPPANAPAAAPEEKSAGGLNVIDLAFGCGLAATAGGFSLLLSPYICVLSWAKKKKRAIDARRKEL